MASNRLGPTQPHPDDHGPAYMVCPEDPRRLLGAPIGMYHCPVCGCMVIAGFDHGPHDDGCWLGLDAEAGRDALREAEDG